ncbi:MAG: 50S ribosomal protein L3 [Gemmatimonadota bacterium]
MMGLLGKKLGMTQVFDEQGNLVPVTVIEAGPCWVAAVRTLESNRYSAVQVGFGETTEKHLTKPRLGHLKKHELPPLRTLVEFRLEAGEEASFSPGQKLSPGDVFEPGTVVDVEGRSKGRGFAGAMKRHGFKGFSDTHGTKNTHRIPGSSGSSADPSKVWKNKKFPGHYGDERTTTRNLRVVRVDGERNLIFVEGAVPGSRNKLVRVTRARAQRKKGA